jgi:Family of unknown function (DUF5522)
MQKLMTSFALPPYHVLLEQSWEHDRREMHEGPYYTFDAQGRRISTRAAFFRAGYCCGERCEGCPYFNWENTMPWFPPADETVKTTPVPYRTIAVLHGRMALQRLLLRRNQPESTSAHHAMTHYYLLLSECWSSEE